MKRVWPLVALAAIATADRSSAADKPAPIYYVLDQRVWRVEADGTGAVALPIRYGRARGLAVAPRSQRVAFVDAEGESVVVASDRAVETRVPVPKGLDARVAELAWSPAEDRLAISGPAYGSG